jgi:hypothetical protein
MEIHSITVGNTIILYFDLQSFGAENCKYTEELNNSQLIRFDAVSYLMLLESVEHERTGYHSDTATATYVSQRAVAQIPLEDQKVLCMTDLEPEIE